jgi:DNA-binding NarL/FixJ family response regulator
VAAGPDRVVVLYSHPLLGEGLGRMLADEPGLTVTTVNLGTLEALDAALASDPDVVVFEEGGPIGVLDVLRRSGATVVIDVDITSSTAWTLQRHALRSAPDEILGAVRAALAGRSRRAGPGASGTAARPAKAVGPGPRREGVAAGS